MSGYTRFWSCRVCGERQESIDYPRVYVCERCIRPLANRICMEMLKTSLGPGIDEHYFLDRAYYYAEILLGKQQRPARNQDDSWVRVEWGDFQAASEQLIDGIYRWSDPLPAKETT